MAPPRRLTPIKLRGRRKARRSFRWSPARRRFPTRPLCEAVARADGGLIDADLGCGVIKQRVARPGEGRSGGYRTLIFFRMGTRVVFAFGFAKNDRDNIGAEDERIFRSTAKLTLGLSDAEIDALVQAGKLEEVDCHD
jgi:hypothetical protein